MPNLENLTPFAALSLPSMSLTGADLLLVVVSARFALPRPGASGNDPLRPTDEQPAVRVVDEYHGKPDASSLRYEGQSTFMRLATDVLVLGQAWAPKGQATTRVDVALVIPNRITKQIAVIGERVWSQGVGGLSATAPRPFVSMPLVYERSFGGAEPIEAEVRPYEPRNPVGRGFFGNATQALYQPLPNLEDPRDLLSTIRDRPKPMGLGPIARSWEPRKSYAGTYDQQWIDEHAPNWPADFDLRFFQAAPPEQALSPHLVGGEHVGLSGVCPDGDLRFVLPHHRVLLKNYFRRRTIRKLMTLDSVLIEPDEGALTMTWRLSVALPDGIFDHEYSVVRLLEPWEDSPS